MKRGKLVIIIVSILVLLAIALILWKQNTEGGITGNAVKFYVPNCGNVGDVNGDGVLSPLDSEVIKQFALGTVTLTEYQRTIADLSNDGKITSLDSSYLNAYLNGYRTTFPLCSKAMLCIDTDYTNKTETVPISGTSPTAYEQITFLDGDNPYLIGGVTYNNFTGPINNTKLDNCQVVSLDGQQSTEVSSCTSNASNCYQGEGRCLDLTGTSNEIVPKLHPVRVIRPCSACVMGKCNVNPY